MSQQNSAQTVWKGEALNFQGSVGSGYQFDIGGGSDKIGGSPMEFLLAGVAGCTAVDVVLMLQKQRQDVVGVEVEAIGTRADEHPMVYTELVLNYLIRGKDVDPKAVERAIHLSEEKYCSASAMFSRAGVQIETVFKIEEVEEP